MIESQCVLCALQRGQDGGPWVDINDDAKVSCEICGKAQISHQALYEIRDDKISAHIVQGYVRYRTEMKMSEIRITTENLDDISNNPIRPNNIPEKLNRLLLSLAMKTPFGGYPVHIKSAVDYPLAFARNEIEFRWLIEQIDKMGYVQRSSANQGYHLVILPTGWSKIEDLRNKAIDKKQCFVAMSFDKTMDPIYDKAISKAIEDAGYRPYRIDREEHAELIPYRMIADIRRSRFVIADFTQQKGGVYFEAGFAMGINIPVIWICHKDDFEYAHFDVKQFNHIIYEDINDLYEKLKVRIEAIIV